MDIKDRIKIEENILDIANSLLKEWSHIFEEKAVFIEPISIYRNNFDNYFSEIEFNFWRDNELLEVFSIIIFMNGKLLLTVDAAYSYINNEIKICYEECFC